MKFLSLFFLTSLIFGAQPMLINGAGATFPFPLYSKWFSEYRNVDQSVTINYQSIGSGGGIKQLLDKTVDFGASDAPMSDEELQKASTPVIHIPTVLGAVVLTYNIPGVTSVINLTSDVIADIYLGKITKWDDAKITALNPKVKFPSTAIFVAYRSDGSGTTSVFTDYLAKVSNDWKSKVGQGKSVNWPVGLGGKGNEGVTGLIKQNPGSIGYVELIYAETNKLPAAKVKNKAGKFIEPNTKNISKAAEGSLKNMPEDFRISITDAEGDSSYPISSFTYLLVYQTMSKDKGSKIEKFLNWAIGPGQGFAEGLSYAKLPSSLVAKVKKKISTITLN